MEPSQLPKYQKLYDEEFPKLVSFLSLTKGETREAAEDAAQEAFTALYLRWKQVKTNRKGWIYTVAIRSAGRNWYKSKREEAEKLYSELYSKTIFRIEAEERAAVMELLGNLPLRQMQVMALTYDGLTPKEIGEFLGIPSGSIRATLRDARKNLKKQIDWYRDDDVTQDPFPSDP